MRSRRDHVARARGKKRLVCRHKGRHAKLNNGAEERALEKRVRRESRRLCQSWDN